MVELRVLTLLPYHGVDVVVAVAQRLHPLAGHSGPDRIVVVEGDALALLVPTGPRLADVVEQRRQTCAPEIEGGPVGTLFCRRPNVLHHCQGVGEHVLVLVDRVLFESHGR